MFFGLFGSLRDVIRAMARVGDRRGSAQAAEVLKRLGPILNKTTTPTTTKRGPRRRKRAPRRSRSARSTKSARSASPSRSRSRSKHKDDPWSPESQESPTAWGSGKVHNAAERKDFENILATDNTKPRKAAAAAPTWIADVMADAVSSSRLRETAGQRGQSDSDIDLDSPQTPRTAATQRSSVSR